MNHRRFYLVIHYAVKTVELSTLNIKQLL